MTLDELVVLASRGPLVVQPGAPGFVLDGSGDVLARFYNPVDAQLWVWMHERRTAIAAMQEFIERVHLGEDGQAP